MDLARGIKFNAGDDETIIIEIKDGVLSEDLNQYDAYWELKKSMDAEPIVSKSSYDSIPSSVQWMNDYANKTIVGGFSQEAQTYLEANPDFTSTFKAYIITALSNASGQPSSVSWTTPKTATITGSIGTIYVSFTMTGTYSFSRVFATYNAPLNTLMSQMFPTEESNISSQMDAELGITPADGDVLINPIDNTVTILLDEEDTTSLYGEYTQYLYVRHKATLKKSSIVYGPVIFMESFDAEYPTTTYCTPEDVAQQLQLVGPDGSRLILTETTSPSRSQVIKYIIEAEGQVDRTTKDSWKEQRVVDEYHDLKEPLSKLPNREVRIPLEYSGIRPIDGTKGDSIKFWTGNTYTEYANIPIERGNSWWIDYPMGVIHFDNMWPFINQGIKRIQCTYRYGKTSVPGDITQATTYLVCIRLLQSEFNKLYIMNQKPNVDWSSVIEDWNEQIKLLLNNHKRTIFTASRR